MTPSFHKEVIKDRKLNTHLVYEHSIEFLKHNDTPTIARAMSLWSAGYQSSGKESVIVNWKWRSPQKNSKPMSMVSAWQHLMKSSASGLKKVLAVT